MPFTTHVEVNVAKDYVTNTFLPKYEMRYDPHRGKMWARQIQRNPFIADMRADLVSIGMIDNINQKPTTPGEQTELELQNLWLVRLYENVMGETKPLVIGGSPVKYRNHRGEMVQKNIRIRPWIKGVKQHGGGVWRQHVEFMPLHHIQAVIASLFSAEQDLIARREGYEDVEKMLTRAGAKASDACVDLGLTVF